MSDWPELARTGQNCRIALNSVKSTEFSVF